MDTALVSYYQQRTAQLRAAEAIMANDVLKPHREYTCPVCQDPQAKARKFVMMATCEHVVHKTCAKRLLKATHVCPVCKKEQSM